MCKSTNKKPIKMVHEKVAVKQSYQCPMKFYHRSLFLLHGNQFIST